MLRESTATSAPLRTLGFLVLGLLVSAATGSTAEDGSRPSVGTETAIRRILVLGDSLAAGYGLSAEEAFPARLEGQLKAAGRAVEVVNAGVSGDTSSGGEQRLPWLLRQMPDIVIVELGANDGLRGLPVEATEANLRRILQRITASGAEPLLVGMKLPPNYGAVYVESFEAIYPRLARELDVPLLPFLLEGVAGQRELNLEDGIHPNAAGHGLIAELLLPPLLEILDRLES